MKEDIYKKMEDERIRIEEAEKIISWIKTYLEISKEHTNLINELEKRFIPYSNPP